MYRRKITVLFCVEGVIFLNPFIPGVCSVYYETNMLRKLFIIEFFYDISLIHFSIV